MDVLTRLRTLEPTAESYDGLSDPEHAAVLDASELLDDLRPQGYAFALTPEGRLKVTPPATVDSGARVRARVAALADALVFMVRAEAICPASCSGDTSPMAVLPPRTYGPDGPWRRRWLAPESTSHPAKMNAHLCRDLFLRYTLPGQTVLDPFGGVGTSLLGCGLGRDVVLVEIEPRFVAFARANWARLRAHQLPGVTGGRARIEQGDSRRLPLPTADSVAGIVTSPPFGSMQAPDCGGAIKARPKADGSGFEGERADYLYSEDTPGQIGNLPLGDVAAVVSSPPYGDVASRNRSAEPYALAHPERETAFGTRAPNRHVDGYGDTPGNIGNEAGETFASAMLEVLAECYRVVIPGGVLVLVSGNYVREGRVIDLAADIIALCRAAGWTPWERWQHQKSVVSFWRRLHHRQGRPVVTEEDVLVFVKGEAPGWVFGELPPTARRPVELGAPEAAPNPTAGAQLPLLDGGGGMTVAGARRRGGAPLGED